MTKEDAEKIIEILAERAVEYYVRGRYEERAEIERLQDIVRKLVKI